MGTLLYSFHEEEEKTFHGIRVHKLKCGLYTLENVLTYLPWGKG